MYLQIVFVIFGERKLAQKLLVKYCWNWLLVGRGRYTATWFSPVLLCAFKVLNRVLVWIRLAILIDLAIRIQLVISFCKDCFSLSFRVSLKFKDKSISTCQSNWNVFEVVLLFWLPHHGNNQNLVGAKIFNLFIEPILVTWVVHNQTSILTFKFYLIVKLFIFLYNFALVSQSKHFVPILTI